eukprot:365702-Chlamydomonas_euryale.AAC.10
MVGIGIAGRGDVSGVLFLSVQAGYITRAGAPVPGSLQPPQPPTWCLRWIWGEQFGLRSARRCGSAR